MLQDITILKSKNAILKPSINKCTSHDNDGSATKLSFLDPSQYLKILFVVMDRITGCLHSQTKPAVSRH